MTDPLARLTAALADRYRIEKELGAGGMATVYLAEDIKHHRKVAIKVLREDLAASLGAARFLREIEIAAALQHPNILPLLDSGVADGFLYYVMPFVAGQSLRERLAREQELPIAEAVRLIVEVVDALAHAHEHNVVHRDIKPDNVMLSGRHALVTDFGVAKAVSEATGRQTLTTLGVALGTPAYMSPEQATADPHIDHRSDIYSVGAMAYELLTGRPPFTGTTPQQVLSSHVTGTPDPVSKHRPGVTPALESVVMRCLEKRPADRWQTAQELLTQLEPFATPSGGMTPTMTRPVAAVAGRRPSSLMVGGVVLAAIVAVAMFVLRPSPISVRFGNPTQVTSDAGLEIFPSISPDGKFVAYTAARSGQYRIFVRPVGGSRTIALTDDSTAEQTQPRFSPDGEQVLFLSRGGVFAAPSLGGQARALIAPSATGAVTNAAWSPNGDQVAYVRGDSLFVGKSGALGPRFVANGFGLRNCVWSPRTDYIACTLGNEAYVGLGSDFGNLGASRIVVVGATGGNLVSVTDSISLNQSPVWSPDGQHLYFISQGTRDVFVLGLRTGRVTAAPVRVTVGLNAQTISLSADGARMAYSVYSDKANIHAIPFSSTPSASTVATPVTTGSQTVESMRASPDGKWLLYDSNLHGNSDIFRIALSGGDPERLTTDSADESGEGLSPDGRQLVFHSFRTGSRRVFVQPLDGGPLQQVTSGPGEQRFPNWSPDGDAIVFVQNPGAEAWVVRRQPGGSWSPPIKRAERCRVSAWSPDGRTLVGSNTDGEVVVTPADSGSARTLYAPGAGAGNPQASAPMWSPDGRTIYFRESPDARGRVDFWSLPATGGRPTRVATFADPLRPSYKAYWTTDFKRFFFAINDRQSDIWVVELNKR